MSTLSHNRENRIALLLAGVLILAGCTARKELAEPVPTPAAEETASASPTPEPTEEPKKLWGFPIDDTHDAFEVPTGGRLGTVLVTVEMKDEKPASTVSVWNTSDLETPIQTIEAEGATTHRHELVDANFDGYMDFVYTWFSGAKNNDSGLYVWDEEQGYFVLKKDFAGDLMTDGEKNRIYIYTNGAGPSGTAKIFHWENEEMILKRIIDFLYPETLEDGTIRQDIAVKDIVDGAWREVYRETYHTPDEIAAAMDAYYGGTLLWYDLDYHGENGNTLWGFPIDDTHDAFEVPTGGRLGTVLVTVEIREKVEIGEKEFYFSVWTDGNLDEPIQTMTVEGWERFRSYYLTDANFDGYTDFCYSYALAAANARYEVWVWDEEQGRFIGTGQLVGMGLTVDKETKTLYHWVHDSAASGCWEYYRWEDGALVCFRKEEITYPDENFHQEKVVYERINGELVEISREPYEMKG